MRPLEFQQKMIIVLVSVIAVTALGMQLYRLPINAKRPFVREVVGTFKTLDQQAAEETQRLKDSDSDRDGLSDYDEIYIYRTSAYNEDSDSDGIPDGDEVRKGTDPNCPLGKNCGVAIINNVQPPISQPPAAPQPTPAAPTQDSVTLAFVSAFGSLDQLTPATISAKVDVMTSKELRDFLMGIGIPQQALDKSDDATLRELLKQTVAEVAATP